MKKLMIALALVGGTMVASAWPCGPHPCGPHPWGPGPGPHHYYRGGWGPGGCNFWPGFVGGLAGGIIANAVAQPTPVVVSQPVVTTPVVVQQPVVVSQPTVVSQPVVAAPVTQTQNVWVEGRYVDQVQANGTVVRVWNPGHYEQRTVVVQ